MTDPSTPMMTPTAFPAPAANSDRLRRLLVPIVWEALLFFAALIAAAVLIVGTNPPVDLVLTVLAPIGLVAVAVALSLRTATVNLAVGAQAVLAAVVGVTLANNDMPLAVAMAAGVAAAAVSGLVLGAITAALSVPSWAVTLGGAAIIEAALIGSSGGRTVVLQGGAGSLWGLWFILFVLLTLGGGALFLIPGVRVKLSQTRDVTPAGRWGGLLPGLGAVAGLTASALVAGIAGVALTLRLQASPNPSGLSLTLSGLAIALLGGVSVFGRRAGVAGVLLATILLGSVQQIVVLNDLGSWVSALVTGIAVLIGLVATRLTETVLGREKRQSP